MGRNLVKRSITDGGTKYSTRDSSGVVHSAPTAGRLSSNVVKEEKRKIEERIRLEKLRLEAKRREEERLEAERLERKRLEEAELEAERLEKERLEEEERLEKERLEKERLEKEERESEEANDREREIDKDNFNKDINNADPPPEEGDGGSSSDKWNPFSKASLEGINDLHLDLFSGGGATNFQDAMTYYEGIVYKLGGVLSLPGMPTAPAAHLAMLGADLSHELRTASADDWNPTTDNRTEDEKNFNTRLGDRILRTMDVVGALLDGTPQEIAGIPGFDKVSQDDDNEDFFGGVGKRFETLGNKSLEKLMKSKTAKNIVFGFDSGIFNALSKFETESQRIRSLHGIRVIESDRYYSVMYHPSSGITYVEWNPTTDVRNVIRRDKRSDVGREWSEDFIAALGMKIPAWSKRVKYIKEKYGMESDTTKHYGYSRGGGLATHLGGVGYGTGYFSSYLPHRASKSKLSGDKMHDLIINPLSYAMMLRNITRT
uniref:Uncharacterized protein n=1 Tax=viral metagenome TaxID=1070528 RepID=A0A2V0RLH3_9ZZZZ